MKNFTFIFLCLLATACTQSLPPSPTTQESFFNSLNSLCGQQFLGEMTYPLEGQDSFSGKKLIAYFEECTKSHIKIAFAVGDDQSRTWIIRKFKHSLELKHDHRLKDGSPDPINFYGGKTQVEGRKLKQSFIADAHTAKIIPAASSNVWTISLNQEKTELTYHLERHQKPRFTAILNLKPQ